MTSQTTRSEIVYGEKERADVHQQLERLLENPHFSNSKRFPSFLRFIIQEELVGRGDQLKERTLGMEVFGRDPGYDTTSDPIVRVTAAEIRKRIAQYYQEAGRPDELRISLPPGSYVPHFEWPKAPIVPEVTPAIAMPIAIESGPSTLGSDRSAQIAVQQHEPLKSFPVSGLLACALLLAIVFVGGWTWIHLRPTTLDRFWSPVLSAADSVVVCFPQSDINGIVLRDAANPLQQRRLEEKMNGVVVDDLQPLVSLSGLLQMRHQRYNLIGEEAATLTTLRQGPAIFIGAFDNPWTLRLTRDLRFRFGNDPQMTQFWIEDTQSPAKTHWGVDRNVQQTTNNYRDYAIVARFRDANTGQLAVVAAGIARGGTVAAGEFLTQPGDMDSIRSQAPKDWAGQNMEFVLSTEIIDGRSSPPKVEATYFW
jgi:hypothetical protein